MWGLSEQKPESALISYSKILQHCLKLKLILFDTVYLAKTYWHGTFFNIRRFRLLFVTSVREDSCITWLTAGSLWELPTINNLVYFQVLSLNVTLTYSLKNLQYLTDTSTGEICNNAQESHRRVLTQLPSSASACTETSLLIGLKSVT